MLESGHGLCDINILCLQVDITCAGLGKTVNSLTNGVDAGVTKSAEAEDFTGVNVEADILDLVVDGDILNAENNLIALKGAIPGPNGGLVIVRTAIKQK